MPHANNIEKEIYQELKNINRDKDTWEKHIDFVAKMVAGQSLKIQAKALWILGEMGLRYPARLAPYIDMIVSRMESDEALLRERSLNALGRIGRGDFKLVEPYLSKMFGLAEDKNPRVRLSFIWASENIATNTPGAYSGCMDIFCGLLEDEDTRVRIEAPEIFRVLGKREPEMVEPYLDKLRYLSENDSGRVVRVHAAGAIRATLSSKRSEVGDVQCPE